MVNVVVNMVTVVLLKSTVVQAVNPNLVNVTMSAMPLPFPLMVNVVLRMVDVIVSMVIVVLLKSIVLQDVNLNLVNVEI